MFEAISIDSLLNWLHFVFIEQFDLWVIFGFVAQGMFGARFLIQWIASEREGRSIIPTAFWYFSVAGGLLLLIYAIHRKDPVFIAGQSLNLFIYFRNIWFIFKERKSLKP